MSTEREGRHARHVATVREVVVRRGLVVVDELRLGPLHDAVSTVLGVRSYAATRLAVDEVGEDRVHVLVTTDYDDPDPSPVIGTGDDLGHYRVEELDALLGYARSAPPFPSNAEVARVYELTTSRGGASVRALANVGDDAGALDERARRVVESALDPEGHSRVDVLVATSVLEALSEGVPVEWALRRAGSVG